MAGSEEERGRRKEGEDLFEDLGQFFAPLEEWPEEEGRPAQTPAAPEPPEAGEGPAPGEDWDVEIEVPDERELVAEEGLPSENGPEEPSPQAGEPVEVPEEESADAPLTAAPAEGGEPLTVDDLRQGPPEYEALPIAEGDEVEESVLSAEELFEEPEPAPAGPIDGVTATRPEVPAGGEREEGPEPEAVEAAAEHFATGLRDSPDEVERELLSDLESPPDEAVTTEPGVPETAPPPTWQEGAEAIEEGVGEAPTPPSGRNVFAAFASGILLAVAVIALLVIGKGPFTVFAAIVILLGQAELYAVMRTQRLQPATLLGLVCGALILSGAYLRGAAAASFGLVLAMGLAVLWYAAAPVGARRNTTVGVGATIFGVVYVPFLASFAILLLATPGDLGRNMFLVVLGLTVLYDVIAYAVGTLWGNRPLAPTISPNKSWEGVIGATLGVLIVSLAIVPAIEPFTSSRAVGLALVIAVVAPLGDLVESAIKRDLGVKDMGTILPGHGGILDRIDAILFSAPAAYYFLQMSF